MNPLRIRLFVGLVWFLLIALAHAQPVIISQPAGQTNLPGSSASFTVSVNGAGPFTYQWQYNGTNLPNNIITTIAGGGSNGYAGDGGPAIGARLNYPYGMVSDPAGDLYIADAANNRIRKVDTNGIITTVAGSGFGFPVGDGGAATNAGLNGPLALALDAAGNLFIADTTNNRIRKVDTNGIITTIAGKNFSGFSGDGGLATNANLYHPSGVVLDGAGNLYVADSANHRIRKVGTNGIITTAAGGGYMSGGYGGYGGDGGTAIGSGLNSPSALAFDGSGNLYIADTGNARIRKVDAYGIITTVAGNGTSGFSGDGGVATNTSLFFATSLAADAFGSIYIADTRNYRIRKVDSYGFINTVAGNGLSSVGFGISVPS